MNSLSAKEGIKPGGLNSRDQSRSRFLDLSGQDYFFSQSRFLKSRLLNRDLAASRFLSRLLRLLRLIKIFKICQDFSRFLYFCRDFDDVFCILETKILNFPHFLPILKPILKQKSKQKMLGTKILIEMFGKINYFLIKIEK
jgi:hypothetical protein